MSCPVPAGDDPPKTLTSPRVTGFGKRLGYAAIQLYRRFLSPFMGGQCRFTPSCSVYGLHAMEKYGFFTACWKTAYRILRCNPWGGHGHDPA